ncbi:MAG: NosD domain-containing protein [Candidatus Thorarchaeota archaeon]
MNRKRVIFASVLITILVVLGGGYEETVSIESHHSFFKEFNVAQYVDHDPIIISSDLDFIEQGWRGNGTIEEPYIIEGLNISSETPCITIENTVSHFVIRDSIFHMSYYYPSAIHLLNLTHGAIHNCSFTGEAYAIYGKMLSNLTISDNDMRECRSGVVLEESEFCWLTNNTLIWEQYNPYHSEDSDGISLNNINQTYIFNNTLLHSHTGIDLYKSFNNSILSNTVVAYWCGISVRQGAYNCLYQNRVGWATEVNARDFGYSNSWDDNISVGNSWSDYVGEGIYEIGGTAGSIDKYPMVFVGDYHGPEIEGLLRYSTADIFYGDDIGSVSFEANVSDPSGVDTVLILYGTIKDQEYYEMEYSPTLSNPNRFEYVIEDGGSYFSITHCYWANDTLGQDSQTVYCSFSIAALGWDSSPTITTVQQDLLVVTLLLLGFISVVALITVKLRNRDNYPERGFRNTSLG